MAEKGSPGLSSRGRERIAGKHVVFKGVAGNVEVAHDAGIIVPEVKPVLVEEEDDMEAEKGPYAELRKEWEKKNELLRATEALGRFSAEGGQELIAVFGIEKVAAALDHVLARPVDERTGLYMLVRTLEPNLAKRKKVYAKMLKAADEETRAYEAGLAEMRTPAERKEYRELHGGDYAPTAEMAMVRKTRIREYQLYDRAAFTPLVGPLISAMERAISGQQESKKWAIQQLKGTFARNKASFIKGLKDHGGSLTKLVSLRLERVARAEHRLEGERGHRIRALVDEHADRLRELRAPIDEQLEALFRDYDRMVPDDLNAESVGGKAILEAMRKKFDDIANGLEEAYRQEVLTKLGAYSTEIEKLETFDVFKDE